MFILLAANMSYPTRETHDFLQQKMNLRKVRSSCLGKSGIRCQGGEDLKISEYDNSRTPGEFKEVPTYLEGNRLINVINLCTIHSPSSFG